MAKQAKLYSSTTWVSLREARALVAEAYGSTQLAERLLVEWLGQELVQWSCRIFKPSRVSESEALESALSAARYGCLPASVAYGEGDPAFWRMEGLRVSWEEGWARETYADGGNEAYGVRVVHEDVLSRLPEQSVVPVPTGSKPSNKTLITVEVERRAAAGEHWDNITPLSENLSGWLKAVHDRTLEPRTIENRLRDWDLWSLLSKK
jgi:hypothetical protein